MKNRKNETLKTLQHVTSYHSRALSQREIDVLTLSAQGKKGDEIALALNISEDTVKDHLERVRRKLNTLNKTHSVAVALLDGLIKPQVRLDKEERKSR